MTLKCYLPTLEGRASTCIEEVADFVAAGRAAGQELQRGGAVEPQYTYVPAAIS